MGYGGTRLDDIATEAGLSRTGLYHHFPSRRAILIEVGHVAELAWQQVVRTAKAIPTKWGDDDILRLIDAELEFLDVHGAVIPIWFQATWADPELRDLGLPAMLQDYGVIGRELARLRGARDVVPEHEGIIFTGMIERLWFYAHNGGRLAIDEAAMRETLLVQVRKMLQPAALAEEMRARPNGSSAERSARVPKPLGKAAGSNVGVRQPRRSP